MIALVPLAPLAGKTALALAGGEIVRQTTRAFASGAAFQAGAELVSQIAEWTRSIDADWDSQGMEPGGSGDECWEVDNSATCWITNVNPPNNKVLGSSQKIKRIISVKATSLSPGAELGSSSEATLETTSGEIIKENSGAWPIGDAIWSLEPEPGNGCIGQSPGSIAPPLALPPIQDGDCTINVTLEGFLANPNGTGNVEPVWLMEPAQELRAGGGVIVGQCNFSPTVVVGGGGDGNNPPYTIPSPPDKPPGSDPWWKAVAQGIVAGATEELLENLLNQPYPGTTYRLVSVCETDASGEPISQAVEEVIPQAKFNDAVLFRLDALVPLLQGQKDFKQPVCPPVKLQGEFRTIGFISDETSPNGKSRLIKRLRYRSLSGIDLDGLIDHWKDFTWNAGPVTVKHRGASWGTITVWAASAAEGKRVIRHAAGEAGIDADQAGRWEISGSSSSRLGMPGTMKVNQSGNHYWITARDGSTPRPQVGRPWPDLLGPGLTQVGKTPHN